MMVLSMRPPCCSHIRSVRQRPHVHSLTKGLDDRALISSANCAVLVAALLFSIFVLIGQPLLSLFGSPPRVQGGRGLVLLLMAMEIVFGLNLIRSGDQNVAWVIIATPILSGPGSYRPRSSSPHSSAR